MTTHVFFGYTKNCKRVAKELGIPDPTIITSPVSIMALTGPITEHICLPWEGSEILNAARSMTADFNDVTTIYHHHRNEKGPSMAPGPGKPHPNHKSS